MGAGPPLRPHTLADLLVPLSPTEFLRDIQGTHYRYLPGPAERFTDLLPWPRLNAILHEARLDYPRLRLSIEGELVTPENYTRMSRTNRGVDVPKLLVQPFTEYLRRGATMVVSAIDELHPPIEELTVAVERELRARASVNAYAAFHNESGFNPHWDDHDVFVLQLHGRKKWVINGPARRFPLYRDIERNTIVPSRTVAQHLLSPGDALYLPRGWWHSATPIGEPSLHLTIGYIPATGIDLLQWLTDQLRAEEIFRRDLPQHHTEEDRREFGKSLLRALKRMWADDIIDRYLADRDARSMVRPAFSLPWSATDEVLPAHDNFAVRLLVPRARLSEGSAGEAIELHADRRRFAFAPAALPVLSLLIDGQFHSITEVYRETASHVPPATIRALMAQLVLEGLLVASEECTTNDKE